MSLKPGYKQTEIGVIPDDWEVKGLLDVCAFKSGKAHEPFISELGKFVCVNSKFISTEGRVRKYATKNLSPAMANDILMVMSDLPNGKALAKAYLAEEDNVLAVNQRLCSLTSRGDYPKFLFYVLNRNKYFLKFDDGVNQTHLLNKVFSRCRISVPNSVKEQKAIAEALSDVDALIDSLEALLIKKRNIKTGVMQELLTGRTRLPGFTGDWKEVRLGDLVSQPITDGPHLTPKFYKDGVPFLSVNNIVGGKILWNDLRYISREDDMIFSVKCKPKRGDILFGKAASVGKIALVDTDIDFNVWSPLAVIRCSASSSPQFVHFALQSSMATRQIVLLTNSSSQGNIGMTDIAQIEILLPPPKEQKAIASVLSDMDDEIEALEKRLAKTRDLKQGMAQELLTGRTRLV